VRFWDSVFVRFWVGSFLALMGICPAPKFCGFSEQSDRLPALFLQDLPALHKQMLAVDLTLLRETVKFSNSLLEFQIM